MAGQNETTEREQHPQNAITLGFSMLAGLGVVLMMCGAALGVIQGEQADNNTIGLIVLAGALMFISGVGVWLAYVRPWETFDDINQPKYHGHHDHGDHAIVPTDQNAVIEHHES